MRFLTTVLIALMLALPLSARVKACEEYAGYEALAQATAADAAKKKDEKVRPKKTAMKKNKEKVEYMRAAPMPAGAK